jgi:hypothetical protein
MESVELLGPVSCYGAVLAPLKFVFRCRSFWRQIKLWECGGSGRRGPRPAIPRHTPKHFADVHGKMDFLGGVMGMQETSGDHGCVEIYPIEYFLPLLGSSIGSVLCRVQHSLRIMLSPIPAGLKGKLLLSSYSSYVHFECIKSCSGIH